MNVIISSVLMLKEFQMENITNENIIKKQRNSTRFKVLLITTALQVAIRKIGLDSFHVVVPSVD